MNIASLSSNHPLRTDPNRPWPYRVVIGYRRTGSRQIVGRRAIYIRATGYSQAEVGALREARRMLPLVKDGQRLIASRPVACRPLDNNDRINMGGASWL